MHFQELSFFGGRLDRWLFCFPPTFLKKESSYLCFLWLADNMLRIFSDCEKLGATLAQHLVFCLLIPLGNHACCSKWFLLARLEYFPRLPLLWWQAALWSVEMEAAFQGYFLLGWVPLSRASGVMTFKRPLPQGLPLRCLWIDREKSLACVWQKFSIESFPFIQRQINKK